MNKISFSLLKKKICNMVESPYNDRFNIESVILSIPEKTNWRTERKKVNEEMKKIIRKWDIRKINELLNLFPVLPEDHKNKKLLLEETEKDWILVFE